MKDIILTAALILGPLSAPAAAQVKETDAVAATLNNYMLGSSYNNPERIKSAFYMESDMFLHHPEKPIYLMNPETYADLFAKREKGKFNGRYAKILDIDIEGEIATAKAEILLPRNESRYIDIFLLKKLDGEWKIISKAAGRADSARTGEKILLIITDKAKGEDFSDLVADYEIATEAGYTVDFVSPEGGAVAFKGLDMANAKHKGYLYNADFMYALENTLPAANAKAADYVAAHYVCDQDAKSSKAGHSGIDALYSDICTGENSCAE